MHQSDHIKWSSSGKTFCQFCTGKIFDFNVNKTFNMMSFCFSTWPFPEGLQVGQVFVALKKIEKVAFVFNKICNYF